MHDESHLFLIEKKNVLKYDLKLLNNNDFCLIYMKHNLITVKQKHLGHCTDLIANNRTIGIISFSHQIQCYFFFITRRCLRRNLVKNKSCFTNKLLLVILLMKNLHFIMHLKKMKFHPRNGSDYIDIEWDAFLTTQLDLF